MLFPGATLVLLCAVLVKLAVSCWHARSRKRSPSGAKLHSSSTASPSTAAPGAAQSREKGLLVGIEGNISSGKSTVCAHLQNGVCGATGQVTRVMFEQISPLLLKLFYGAASRYAFTLQLTTLQKRIDNIWRMRASCDAESSIGLLDRSTMGDLIFAIKQYLDQNIDEPETAVYVEEWVRSVLHAGYFVDQVCVVWNLIGPHRLPHLLIQCMPLTGGGWFVVLCCVVLCCVCCAGVVSAQHA